LVAPTETASGSPHETAGLDQLQEQKPKSLASWLIGSESQEDLEFDELDDFSDVHGLRSIGSHGLGPGIVTAKRKNQPRLTETSLGKMLARFPMLSFDWEDPLQLSNLKSAFKARAQSRAVSREAVAGIFRRLDTDGDGWVKPADLRVWRRMLPLGRSEEALIVSVMVGAKSTTAVAKRKTKTKSMTTSTTTAAAAAAPPVQRANNRLARRLDAGKSSAATSVAPPATPPKDQRLRPPSLERLASPTTAPTPASAPTSPPPPPVKPKAAVEEAPKESPEEEMERLARGEQRIEEARGIKQWDLFMTLRADPILSAELVAQCALLDFMISGDVHGPDEVDEDDLLINNESEVGLSKTRKAGNLVDSSDSNSEDEGDGVQMLEVEDVDAWAEAPLEGLNGLQKKRRKAAAKMAKQKAKQKKNSARDLVAQKAKARPTGAKARETVYGQGTKGNCGVPDDAAVAAFVCVAKMKLCRLAVAAREAVTREDTVAGEVFSALDPQHTSFVTTHDILRYLQDRANLYTVTSEDLALIVGDHALEKSPVESSLSSMNWSSPLDMYHHRNYFNSSSSNHLGRPPSSNNVSGKPSFSSLEASLPSALRMLHQQRGPSRSELVVFGGGLSHRSSSSHNLMDASYKESYLDRVAWRQVLSDPAHHNLATLLHRFVSTQVNSRLTILHN